MAATTAGATMKFDIVADPSQFNQAVASAQQNWAKATGEMQAAAAPVGEALTAAVSGAAAAFSSFGDSLASAFTGGAGAAEKETIKAFDAIKAQAAGLLDHLGSLGEKWGGSFGKRVGEAVANAAKGSIGGVATSAVEKLDSLVPAEKLAAAPVRHR